LTQAGRHYRGKRQRCPLLPEGGVLA
jgi:hypothetical protein